jgi:hypothetical protein
VQWTFVKESRALTSHGASGCIDSMKWLALLLLVVLQCSCTTLVNRRDLYSPEPAPGTMAPVTKTTIVTTRHSTVEEAGPLPY